jgi:hypothetical protein
MFNAIPNRFPWNGSLCDKRSVPSSTSVATCAASFHCLVISDTISLSTPWKGVVLSQRLSQGKSLGNGALNQSGRNAVPDPFYPDIAKLG